MFWPSNLLGQNLLSLRHIKMGVYTDHPSECQQQIKECPFFLLLAPGSCLLVFKSAIRNPQSAITESGTFFDSNSSNPSPSFILANAESHTSGKLLQERLRNIHRKTTAMHPNRAAQRKTS
jgi:hypothetical protein